PLRPFRERFVCRSAGKFYVACVAIRDLGVWFAGRRLDVVEVVAGDGPNELAVDEVLDPLEFGLHASVTTMSGPKRAGNCCASCPAWSNNLVFQIANVSEKTSQFAPGC